MRRLSKNVSIECFPPMNEMKTFLKDFSVPYISWFLDLIYLYPSPGLLGLLMATPSLHS